jgi:hypothetical protein
MHHQPNKTKLIITIHIQKNSINLYKQITFNNNLLVRIYKHYNNSSFQAQLYKVNHKCKNKIQMLSGVGKVEMYGNKIWIFNYQTQRD